MIVVYGIPNCDTVKKARAWLAERQVAYRFHDLRRDGVPEDRLASWVEQLGWEALVNRKGTTWRKLEPAAQAAVSDAAGACALMGREASVIRRPVVDWGPRDSSVGFDPARWQARLDGAA
ncbi:ArsC family reductase [Ramlibacter sp. AN1015]|uniref:ArsC family reductase n=1 Tax=Ramlibacter sp. AN1015 TaxID=3133428 RepID=UPI0030BD17FE